MPYSARDIQDIAIIGDMVKIRTFSGDTLSGEVVSISQTILRLATGQSCSIDRIESICKLNDSDSATVGHDLQHETISVSDAPPTSQLYAQSLLAPPPPIPHTHDSISARSKSPQGGSKSTVALEKKPEASFTEYDITILQRVSHISAEIKAQAERTRLAQAIEPDFRSDLRDKKSLTRKTFSGWEALYSKFSNAKKINELALKFSRVQHISSKAKTLWNSDRTHPAFTRHYAYYEILVECYENAENAILVGLFQDPDNVLWYNLAYVYAQQGKHDKELLALRELFLLVPPTAHIDAWLRFINLVYSTGYLELLHSTVKFQREKGFLLGDQHRDAMVYLLSRNGKTGDAERFLKDLDSGRDMLATFQDCVAFLDAPPPPLPLGTIHELIKNAAKTYLPSNGTPNQDPGSTLNQGDPDERSKVLKRARNLRSVGQHGEAIAIARRFLMRVPLDEQVLSFVSDTQAEVRRLGIDLPRGDTPYPKAKRAQFLEKNFDKAIKYFLEAIRSDDRKESAIKDLASLYQQLGRNDDAIKLLETHRKGTNYETVLAAHYQAAGRNEDALSIYASLRDRYKGTGRRKEYLQTLFTIAYIHLKQKQYDVAEKNFRLVLQQNPSDMAAQRWLAEIKVAKSSGTFENIETRVNLETFGLNEAGINLGILSQGALERCEYKGIEARRLKENSVASRDLDEVVSLAKTLSIHRPQDRAEYYLSAAALVLIHDAAKYEHGYDYLRRHFASKGDAACDGAMPRDVIRTYYLESLNLATVRTTDATEKWRTLISYLLTSDVELKPRFSSTRASDREVFITFIQQNPREVWDCVPALARAAATSEFVRKAVVECIGANCDVRSYLSQSLGLPDGSTSPEVIERWDERVWDSLGALQERRQIFVLMRGYGLSVANLENMLERLEQTLRKGEEIWSLDRERIKMMKDAVTSALNFCRAQDFEDRDEQFRRMEDIAGKLIEQIEESPTHFSLECVSPLASHVLDLAKEDYRKSLESSQAELSLELLSDSYHPDAEGYVTLQVQLANPEGRSPANKVRLSLGESEQRHLLAADAATEVPVLRGGKRLDCHLRVKPSQEALRDQAFAISLVAHFKSHSGDEVSTEPQSFTVNLNVERSFKCIPGNPYAPYAAGGPVTDPQMFFGRKTDMENLRASLLNESSVARKCVALYGQKRAGKSSLLIRFKHELEATGKHVAVHLDVTGMALGSAQDPQSEFYYALLYSTNAKLSSLYSDQDDGFVVSRASAIMNPMEFVEGLGNILKHYRLKFKNAFNKGVALDPDFRLVLLIDEFTEIYKLIKKSKLPEEFMKSWKYIVEQGVFTSVLVGQDVMSAFKDEYKNVFASIQDLRISYLQKEDARRLIIDPVGEERYKGAAIERILSLTAGNPYLTMIVCASLVYYINETRSTVVTEADVERVLQSLLVGAQRLDEDKFDGFLRAGDGEYDSGTNPEHTFNLCVAIAKGTWRGWCEKGELQKVLPKEYRLDLLLADLVGRDVIERNGQSYRILVGIFYEWLLRQ